MSNNEKYYIKKDVTHHEYEMHKYIYEISIPTLNVPKIVNYNKVSKEFMSLFPSIDNNTTTTFYEMRSNGKVFQLLKYSSKLVKESTVFSGPPIKEYILEDLFYIYDKADKKMLPLGGSLSLKALKNRLPNYAAQIDALTNANKLNLKKEDDMIQLIQQLK